LTARSALGAAAVAALLACAAPAGASERGFPLRGVGRPGFLLDAVTLPAGSDSVDVEVAWQVPLRELAFRPEDDLFRARYEIAVIFSRDGRQAVGELWERRVRARSIEETRDPARHSHGRRTMRLPVGRYEMRVTVTDRVAGAVSEAGAPLEARAESSGLGLSDLRLVRYTGDGVDRNPAHDVPLGQTGHAVRATIRSEAGAEGKVELRWRILDPGGRRVVDADSTVALGGSESSVVDLPIPSERLSPGTHEVEVRLGRARDADRRTLTLHARVSEAWFAANRTAAVEILGLLASRSEADALRDAPEAEWSAALATFWERCGVASGIPVDAFRREIQDRVESACTLFVEPFRYPGWKTDRGRIWIRWGRPTRRTESAGDLDRPATEVWEYESPRRVFVFVDRGSGEYWLSG
jgi:GWxTD domain-containing protein